MQISVGGFLFLTCKVSREASFEVLQEYILKEDRWEEGGWPQVSNFCIYTSEHFVEGIRGFFDLFGGREKGLEGSKDWSVDLSLIMVV